MASIWKGKIRYLLDYHDGALDVIDNKLQKPQPLGDFPTTDEIKKFKQDSGFYRKANGYAKSMILLILSDAIYQKIMNKVSAYDAW